nr:MAG TPA_asm: hypothetical protein [Caudoviricetes sp.]DAL76400.1 MAG TPA: hypothetical protein [Caudoviricetes sp.]DAY80231.1 MAG TPA: hypothetical protein [Caudoviricetes sp.]
MVKRSSVFGETVLLMKTSSNIGDGYLTGVIPTYVE